MKSKFLSIKLRGGQILVCLLWVLAGVQASGQSTLFVEHNISQVQLSDAEQDKWDFVTDTSFIMWSKLVTMQDLRFFESDGHLLFSLPGRANTLHLEVLKVEENDEDGMVWMGKSVDDGGYAIFNYRNEQKGGLFFFNEGHYQLIPINSQYQALVRYKKDEGGWTCPIGTAAAGEPEFPADITPGPVSDQCDYDPEDYDTCPALISILLAVTPEGAPYIQGTFGEGMFAALAEAMLNLSFYNSDIPNKEVRVSLVHLTNFNYNQTPDISQRISKDLDELEYIDNLLSLRLTYNSDLLCMITDDRYGSIKGLANIFSGGIDDGYSLVTGPYFFSIAAFAHEIGHNLSCRHDWDYDDEPVCAHGYKYIETDEYIPPGGLLPYAIFYRTIVSVPIAEGEVEFIEINGQLYEVANDQPYILHYSNPDVTYGNPVFQTGRSSGKITDNAQAIRNTGCTVAGFNPWQELGLQVDYGPVNCQAEKTFTATILQPAAGLPGVGPYQIDWYWSLSPYTVYPPPTQNTYFASGQTVTLNYLPNCPTYWVRCVVTSADNIQVSRIIKVTLPSICDCNPPPPGMEKSGEINGYQNIIRIFPNPAFDRVYVAEATFTGAETYHIMDMFGRVVKSGNVAFDGGGLPYLNLNSLHDGVYWLTIAQTDDRAYAFQKLILLNSNR